MLINKIARNIYLVFVSTLLCMAFSTYIYAQYKSSASLPLKGEAAYTYWGFKVYDARVYVPRGIVNIQEELGKIPLRLELTYAMDLKKEDFVKSGEVFMRQNRDIPFEQVAEANHQMNLLYEDVAEGDTYAIEHIPGEGITLYLNQIKKGKVPDDKFAVSFLGIWLSKFSLKESFTNQLLGL